MTNGIILLIIICFIIVVRFILWTINVHRHNIIIKEKLGDKVYDWMIYGNDVPKSLPKLEQEINKMIFEQTMIKLNELNKEANKAITALGKGMIKVNSSFQDFSKALSVIKLKDDLWQM